MFGIRLQSFILHTVVYLYVFLFVYAALSKIVSFEEFQVQLGQSPLLGAYATFIFWFVPLSEILIALSLVFQRFRRVSLYAAFTLMVMFTTYIYIILHYSSFVPCSCGGVLEKMGWNEHLIFNLIFIILALIAIYIESMHRQSFRKTIFSVLLFAVLGIVSVVALFLLSENKIQHHNNFIRRIPHAPVKMLKGVSLPYNSFYIAGYDAGKIYLGNHTAPKYILAIDSSLTHQESFRIVQDNHDFHFTTTQVRIKDGYYYFADGSIPVIYSGSIKDWQGTPIYHGNTYFSTYEVVDTTRFVVRAIHPNTGENHLALINIRDRSQTHEHFDILEKRLDGIFDTDGILSYNPNLDVALYTYYYRNQYLLTNPKFDRIVRRKTIDTLQQVPLKFAYTQQGREKTFAKIPEKINTYAATSGNYLYIKSSRLGKYDYPQMLKEASMIDVYQLEPHGYQFSFYLYHYQGEEIHTFSVFEDIIVGLTQQYLVVGRFKKERFEP